MVEAAEESRRVRSHKARTILFFSAMRHFADEIRQRGWRIHYRQLDGAETLTVLEREAKRENARKLLVEGDIWVAAETYTPLRITLHATSGEGAIAAGLVLRGALQHQHAGALVTRRQRRAQRGIAAAHHDHVPGFIAHRTPP
mgnify:CR=1 FL=1